MLTLVPFEAAFYREHGLAVRYVGHPLAFEFPLRPDRDGARRELGLAVDGEVVALLPGSRLGEVRKLAADFFATAAWLARRRPGLRFVVPLVNERVGAVVRAARETHGEGLEVTFLDGRSREAMTAADAVLLASGTAALEAMLLKRPMVVAYRVARLTALLARPLMRVDQFSLPNHLAGRPLVPEFLQDRVTLEHLGPALLRELTDGVRREMLAQEFTRLHELLRRDASNEAAAAILALVDARSTSIAGR
jgi:lipid-A-disaccharide synthase